VKFFCLSEQICSYSFLWSLTQTEELFETTSEEEADAEEAGGTDSVVDVEDLGKIMSHMKKAKVLLLQQLQSCQVFVID